jgi:hypothetical protein
VNEQAGKPEREAVLWTLWKHRELCRNDIATRKRGNRFDNNDPVMLRHTAGCSFYQGQCINIVVHLKSDLIDLETYDYAEAA